MDPKTYAALDQIKRVIETAPKQKRIHTVRELIALADLAMQGLSESKQSTTASRRRALQRRETELDANKPIKPVTVAEPYKPKPMKYSGGKR